MLRCQAVIKLSRKSFDVQAAARQGALLASCMGFCAMHQLQLSIQNHSIASIAAEEMALSTVCSIPGATGDTDAAERIICENDAWPLLACSINPQELGHR